MWFVASLFIAVISTVLVFRAVARILEPILCYLLTALWLRYLLSAFPDITHPKIIAGFSINALGSLGVVGLGILMIPKKYFALRLLGPFYLFVLIVVVSGIVNFEIKGLIEASLRLGYLLVVQLSLLAALFACGWRRVFGALMTVFALPVGLQILSIALNHSTESLDALGRSYIGGYGHESGFAMILMTMMLIAMFWQPRVAWHKGIIVAWGCLGLLFANYRTGIISAAPIVAAIVVVAYSSNVARRERVIGTIFAVTIALPCLAFAVINSPSLMERFSTLGEIAHIDVFRAPFEFTRADQDMLTGRVYIWSQYLAGFADGGGLERLIGHGPESWNHVFTKYAHNTFISYLYEFGILGTIGFAIYWFANIATALRIRDGGVMLKVCAAYGGFTILSLATMPLWQITGVIFFGLLNGATMYAALTSASVQTGGQSYPAHGSVSHSRAVSGGYK